MADVTDPITILPFQTISTSGMTSVSAQCQMSKHCNRTLQGGTSVVLGNLIGKIIELKKGTIVATVKAANVVPPMLVSKSPEGLNHNDNNSSLTSEATPERLEKLFSKLDLSGADNWSEENKENMHSLVRKYHHLFALEDLELGWTSMVKHNIKLTSKIPFRERYHRIPPHQYEEVCEHLKDMLEIGAIRKSKSVWASAVFLIQKKDGAMCFYIDL